MQHFNYANSSLNATGTKRHYEDYLVIFCIATVVVTIKITNNNKWNIYSLSTDTNLDRKIETLLFKYYFD